ncbi:MAG: beta-1,3-glucanase family protein [Candidatus Baltobacteraceae bacterium]
MNPQPLPTPTNVPVGPSPSSVTLYGGSYSLTFTLPAVTSGTGTVAAKLQPNLPSGIVAPSSVSRTPSSKKQSLGPVVPLIYLTVTPSADITFASLPSFLYKLPPTNSIPAGQQTYTMFYDPANSSWLPALGPGAVSGTTVSFASVAGGVALKAGVTYLYALVQTVSATPSPSPTPTPGTTPTPTPAPSTAFATCPSTDGTTFPVVIKNSTGIAPTANLTIYTVGQNSAGQFMYLKDASSGTLQPLPASGQPIPSFTAAPNQCINLPQLIGARVYIVLNQQSIDIAAGSSGGVSQPAPWGAPASSATVQNVWDFLEYTWTGAQFNLDTTQVDDIGIPISFQAYNTKSSTGGNVYGIQANAVTNVAQDLRKLGVPWSGLIQQTGGTAVRVISPKNLVSLFPHYYEDAINRIWTTVNPAYTPSNPLNLNYPGQIPAGTYGYIDPSGTYFNFYSSSGALIAQISKPSTADVFGNSGTLAPTGALPNFIGRALGVNFSRSTMPLPAGAPTGPQPLCANTDWRWFYGGPQTKGGTIPDPTATPPAPINWYGALLHKNGVQIAALAVGGASPGMAYGIANDDECNLYAPDASAAYITGEQWNVTLNPL